MPRICLRRSLHRRPQFPTGKMTIATMTRFILVLTLIRPVSGQPITPSNPLSTRLPQAPSFGPSLLSTTLQPTVQPTWRTTTLQPSDHPSDAPSDIPSSMSSILSTTNIPSSLPTFPQSTMVSSITSTTPRPSTDRPTTSHPTFRPATKQPTTAPLTLVVQSEGTCAVTTNPNKCAILMWGESAPPVNQCLCYSFCNNLFVGCKTWNDSQVVRVPQECPSMSDVTEGCTDAHRSLATTSSAMPFCGVHTVVLLVGGVLTTLLIVSIGNF